MKKQGFIFGAAVDLLTLLTLWSWQCSPAKLIHALQSCFLSHFTYLNILCKVLPVSFTRRLLVTRWLASPDEPQSKSPLVFHDDAAVCDDLAAAFHWSLCLFFHPVGSANDWGPAAARGWVEPVIKIQTTKTSQHTVAVLRLKCFCCFYSVFTTKKSHKKVQLLHQFYALSVCKCVWPATAELLTCITCVKLQLCKVQPEMKAADHQNAIFAWVKECKWWW